MCACDAFVACRRPHKVHLVPRQATPCDSMPYARGGEQKRRAPATHGFSPCPITPDFGALGVLPTSGRRQGRRVSPAFVGRGDADDAKTAVLRLEYSPNRLRNRNRFGPVGA